MKTEYDTLLAGRVKMAQLEQGFRVSQDAVLLAASVQAKYGAKVLDVGVGSAGATLCLAERVSGLHLYGVELQEPLVKLAEHNTKLNGKKLHLIRGDITKLDMSELEEQFDFVFSNPPFFQGQKSPYETLDLAHRETIPLEKWLGFCLRALKPKGQINIIHEAGRLTDILAYFKNRAGGVEVIPIHSTQEKEAIRVIVRATKGSRAKTKLLPSIVLHNADKTLTTRAREIFENMQTI
jgi:tRNA1(Val) A37 N6-methylase TrmN6